MNRKTLIQMNISIVILISVFGFLYFFTGVFGETRINLSIVTNRNLESGLVGHWTFDGVDMDTVSNTAEILDRSGSGYTGDWVDHATTTRTGVVGQSIYFAPTVTTAGCSGDYTSIVSALNPEANWNLTDDGNDDSGNGHNSNNTVGTPTFVSTIIPCAPYTNAMLINAAEGYNYADSVEINTYANPAGDYWAVSLWFETDSVATNNGNIIYEQGGTANSIAVYTYDDAGTDKVFCSAVEGTNEDWVEYDISLDTTYHLGCIWDVGGGSMTMYINGSLVSTDSSLSIGSDLNRHTGDTAIAEADGNPDNHLGAGMTNSFQGNIADIALWGVNDDGAVSGSDFSNIYDAGADTVGDAVSTINDYVDIGAAYNGVQTLAFWMQATSTTIQIIDLNGTENVELSSGTVTANGFTAPTIYVDGIESSLINDTDWHHVVITTGTGINASDMDIGRVETQGFFEGRLDDIRIYDRVLSQNDIERLYGLGATTKINKTLIISPLLEEGLKAHYTFDGEYYEWEIVGGASTTAYDRIGQSNSATGTSPAAIGKLGQGVSFDGVDEYLRSGDIGYASSTAFWIKRDTTGAEKLINIDGVDQIEINGSNQVVATSWPSATVYVDGSSDSTVINDRNWHHVVIIDTTGINAVDFEMGRVGGSYFDGRLDDVRIYENVIPEGTIKRLYQLGATTHINKTLTTNSSLENGIVGHWTMDGKNIDSSSSTAEVADISGNNYSGDWVDHATTTVVGKLGQAVELLGQGDYIDVGDIGSGIKTISLYVKRTQTGTSEGLIGIDGTDNVYINDQNEVVAGDFPSATVYIDGSTATSAITDFGWHHVVVTDSTGVDGSAFLIGASPLLGSFEGRIDDVRVYDRVLSPAEILRLYQLGN